MTDKVFCPWCGTEMEINTKEFNRRHSARMECHNSECNARSPMTKWHDTEEKAIENARAAALRRYTPPLKPMTLEGLRGATLNVDGIAWLEVRDVPREEWEGYYQPKLAMRVDGTEYFQLYYIGSQYPHSPETTDYNKTWRCWSHKPTDEERSAAGWETSRQE